MDIIVTTKNDQRDHHHGVIYEINRIGDEWLNVVNLDTGQTKIIYPPGGWISIEITRED